MEHPKCPYCGGEMKLSSGHAGFIEGRHWYRCDNCNALAPDANSPEAAYDAAMKRDRAKGKTYAEDFLSHYPKAQVSRDGVPFVCRKHITDKPFHCTQYNYNCTACWNEQMEDEDE